MGNSFSLFQTENLQSIQKREFHSISGSSSCSANFMLHNQLGAVELIGRILPKNAALHLVVPPPPASGDLFSFQAHASP